mmetsp:Transcript_12554/g.22174  ORF Transcript_12554/g.22174 Transcript_12554/m.22174 type:complete len:553 (+) Transcript_12554:104-1762(+)
MYTVDQLLEDAAAHRSALTRRGTDDVQQAWDALNRYICDVLDKKQTLNVSNFCKIGWKVEEGWHLKPQMRPHFSVSEAFARACNADSRSQLAAPIKSLALLEEFNFSKCALRFSTSLTKDLVFMGLRAIIAQLADVIASGQEVCIDMEAGTLRSTERVVSFNFLADFYEREGLEAPKDAPKPSDYRPSKTFGEPTADAMSLSVQGSSKAKSSAKATGLGGFNESGVGLPSRRPQTSGTEETAGYQATVTSGSGLSKEELAQRQAMERYIDQMNQEASAVIKAQDLWEDHLQRCIDEEKKDLAWRHALARDYQESLKDQIREQEERKTQGRQHAIEQASMHEFPDFTQVPEVNVYDYLMQRRQNLKDDLDQQVEIKRRQKETQKKQESELDSQNTEANRRLMQKEKHQESIKGDKTKQECKQSWQDNSRLRTVTKAIDDYQKTDPSTRGNMADMVSTLKSTLMEELGNTQKPTQKSGASQTPRTPRREKTFSPKSPHVTLALGPGFDMPQTPMTEEGPPLSSRPATGSTRRFPIGAAASLALTKQRMKERGML